MSYITSKKVRIAILCTPYILSNLFQNKVGRWGICELICRDS